MTVFLAALRLELEILPLGPVGDPLRQHRR